MKHSHHHHRIAMHNLEMREDAVLNRYLQIERLEHANCPRPEYDSYVLLPRLIVVVTAGSHNSSLETGIARNVGALMDFRSAPTRCNLRAS